MNNDTFIYRIDRSDIIIDVRDSTHGCSFAKNNAWVSSPSPADVVGRKIWDFIQGPETRHLYQEIFRRLRAGVNAKTIPFRCDSPGERRYLELLMKALPDDQIEIISKILRREARDPVRLLDIAVERSSEYITICSMCKKIKIDSGVWVEIEEGLVHFKLFEEKRIPGLTHGLCEACYDAAMRELDEIAPPSPCTSES